MRTQESQILAQKIINSLEGYIIIPNWDAKEYSDNVDGMIDEITNLICRDLKNNKAKDREDKLNMLDDYIERVDKVLKEFDEDHKVGVEPLQQKLQEKKESFILSLQQ